MRVIVSHDIDHLYRSDHLFRDLFFPKYYVKHLFALATGKIGWNLAAKRMKLIARKQLHNLPELIQFNDDNKVPNNFFIGMEKGLGLSYDSEEAVPVIKYLLKNGAEVHLHGMNFNDPDKLGIEKNRLLEITGESNLGIRFHYLRWGEQTSRILNELNFLFDSTLENNHSSPGTGVREFPLNIMDVRYISYWESELKTAKKATLDYIDKFEDSDTESAFLVVNFHDVYYNDIFPIHKAWYEWLISELKLRRAKFFSFKEALAV